MAIKSQIKVPQQFGPSHVDLLSSSSDGVWHPSGPLQLDWYGLNPFASLSRARMLAFYSEKFPEASSSLQWALPQDERVATDPTRSNVSIAAQADRPFWLTKPQFLAFCGVRAYPLLQLRKIICALRDRSLPFGRPEVQLIVKQALFQLGELRGAGSEDTLLAWKHEDLVAGGCLDALALELEALQDTLQDRISDHSELLIVIDLMTYAMVFHPTPEFAAIRRRCVAIVRQWIGEREEQISTVADPADVPILRADQCVFAMYGVLAHGGTDELSGADLDSLCELRLQASSGFVFEADSADKHAFVALRDRCQFLMTLRVAALANRIKADGGPLTAAVVRYCCATLKYECADSLRA